MSKIDELAKKITDMAASKKTSAYDTQAKVLRIEDGTAWVHIPGGVDETPVQLTVSAGVGDYVQVRVANGNAWIVGNASNPPTDDTEALNAKDKAISAQEKAEDAMIASERAEEAAVIAETAAVRATEAAEEAEGEAGKATKAANSALRGLAQVEDVVGVVTWMKTHGNYKVSTDTSPQENVIYFSVTQVASPTGNPRENLYYEYDSATQEYSLTLDTAVVDGKSYFTITEQTPVETDNPAQNGWIELTNLQDVVADYVNTHLALTDKGLYVLGDESEWKVLVGTDGVYIIDSDNNVVSYYKDVIVLGKDDGSQSFVRMDYHSIQMFDKENAARSDGVPYFWISDLRNKDGIYHIEENVVFRSSYPSTIKINLAATAIINDNYIVTVNDVVWVNVEKDKNYIKFPSNDLPPDGSEVKISYDSSSSAMKAYTLGIRKKNSFVGPFSYAEGTNTTASGGRSHAEGAYTTASGYGSHAEGNSNTASGYGSHAEGDGTTASSYFSHAEGSDTTARGSASHAEGSNTTASAFCSHAEGYDTTASGEQSHAEGGYTTASGWYSHAEGYETEAIGDYSHAQNFRTIAAKYYQTAIGKYNIKDIESDESKQKAFIIGNGEDENERSNAFEVNWNGDTKAYGKIEDGSGNVLSNKVNKGSVANGFNAPTGTAKLPAFTTTTWALQQNVVVESPGANYVPIAVIACNVTGASSGNIVLKGFDLDGIALGSDATVKTHWTNIAKTNVAANTYTVTVQVLFAKYSLS